MNYNSQHFQRTTPRQRDAAGARPRLAAGSIGGGRRSRSGAAAAAGPARVLSAPPGRAMWQSIGLTLLVIVATLACVLLFMLCGWYVVWQLFLSKFKFLRELIGDTGSQQGDNEPSETETEQETPPSPQTGRQKSARQRRAPTEDTT